MLKIVLSLVIALFVAGSALASPISVLFIGDSVTWGTGASDTDGDGHPNGYVSILGEIWAPYGVEVINAGCSGATIRDWTNDGGESVSCAIWDAWGLLAEQHLPVDGIHISLGGNDAVGFLEWGCPHAGQWGGCWVPVDEYEERIRQLIEKIGEDVAILLSTTVPSPNANSMHNARLEGYREVVMRIAGEDEWDNTYFGADMLHQLSPEFFPDGQVHPNDEGHALIAEILAPRISAIVPEPSTFLLVAMGLIGLRLPRARTRLKTGHRM